MSSNDSITASPTAKHTSRKAKIDHKCQYCSRTYTRSGHLTQHLRTHTGERPYVCQYPMCGKTFMRSDHLQRHSLSHQPKDSYEFKCSRDSCGKAFTTKARLERHQALHDRPTPFKCTICDESFAKKRGLGEHYAKKHEGEMPHKCKEPGCTSAFLRPSELQRHFIKVHTEKTYMCMDPACLELPAFSKFSDLQRHLRRDHKPKPSNTCDKCGKSFRSASSLSKHRETHDIPIIDRLSVHCPFEGCNAVYTKRSNLNSHIRSKHTEQDAFVCELCDKTFSLKSSLKRHMLNIHAFGETDQTSPPNTCRAPPDQEVLANQVEPLLSSRPTEETFETLERREIRPSESTEGESSDANHEQQIESNQEPQQTELNKEPEQADPNHEQQAKPSPPIYSRQQRYRLQSNSEIQQNHKRPESELQPLSKRQRLEVAAN